MAPIGQMTFHGISNTTGLNIPALFEMPKLTATVPLTSSQSINPYHNFSVDIAHSSNQPSPSTSTFLPTNLLMPCNLSFLTPPQLALYALQLQSQQQSPTAINNTLLNPMNVGMVTQFMPAFIQQPFFGSLPLAALPIQAPTQNISQLFQSPISQMVSKPDQTSPIVNFLNCSQSAFFNNPSIINTTPNLSTSCLNSNLNNLPHRHQNDITFTLVSNNNNFLEQQKEHQQISPPILRNESPEINDPNLPPMLQPELPCSNDYMDNDEFAAPPELLPLTDRFMFDDECGPPRLEPQVPIITNLEADHVNNDERIQSPDVVASVSPPTNDLSPTEVVTESEHQLLDHQSLLTDVLSKTLSSPDTETNFNRKRERSTSLDLSDATVKMPKLVSMVNETEVSLEEIAKSPVVEESSIDKEEVAVTVEQHDTSIASSSGVSSANSSLMSEEPIMPLIIRFKRPLMEPKPIQQELEKVSNCFVKAEELSAPLTPVQNIKELRSRLQKPQTKKPIKKRKRRGRKPKFGLRKKLISPTKNSRKVAKYNSVWQPMDPGHMEDFRLSHENQSKKRRCFKAIQHTREHDETIRVRDCIKVQSDEGLENIGKVVRLFLDETDNAINVQVLWYYTQAQVDSKDILLHEKELLASKHCDVINADSIEEHAFVLTYNEYCRFVAETRIDELPPTQRPLESSELHSRGEPEYARRIRLPHEDSPIDLVYWCSRTFSLKTRKICVTAIATSRRGSRNSNGNGRRR